MEVKIDKAILSLTQGDITREETDAIVNAANSRLAGGGGVDGAIHRAAGPALMEETRKFGGCPTGQAVITSGGHLKAKHVIHTVGPIYRDGTRGETDLLRSAYHSSLKLASENKLKSVSFPSISTGAYGYPLKEAAGIALGAVVDYLRQHDDLSLVRFVLFDDRTYGVYAQALAEMKLP